MGTPRISVLIHTRNEERWIADCIRSAAWADEVVIADMASTDATRSIAVGLGARVVEVPMAKNVDEVRNQAMGQCTGDWLLVVDADERVSPGLAARVREIVQAPAADAYWVPRKNYFFETWMQHSLWPDPQMRFFRRGVASWSGVVHEAAEIRGRSESLPPDPELALEHPGACFDITHFFQKYVRYSSLELARTAPMSDAGFLLFLIRRTGVEFVLRYFGGGWREGMAGLVFSAMRVACQIMVAAQVYARDRGSWQPISPATLRRRVRWECFRTAVKLLRP